MSSENTSARYLFEGNEEQDNNAKAKPERNLLAAVLSRAICDAFGTAQCEKHVIRNARKWLFGSLTPREEFSFAWVALHLDLDPVSLQDSLRNYEDHPDQIQDRLVLLK